MTKKEYLEFHKEFVAKMVETTLKKNADYTGAGDNPFANFEQVGHLIPGSVRIGFLTRMSDKMSRIASYVERGYYDVEDEKFLDTCLDLANYCALFAGYMKGHRDE